MELEQRLVLGPALRIFGITKGIAVGLFGSSRVYVYLVEFGQLL